MYHQSFGAEQSFYRRLYTDPLIVSQTVLYRRKVWREESWRVNDASPNYKVYYSPGEADVISVQKEPQ